MEFDRYTVALLIRTPNAPPLSPEAGARAQDEHMAYLAQLHDEGRLLAAGPFLVGPEVELRGLTVSRDPPEEVRRLGQADPLVKEGQLTWRVLPWTLPSGAVSFSHTRFPRSMSEV